MDTEQTNPPAPTADEQTTAFCALAALTDDPEFADSLLRCVLPNSTSAARWYYWSVRHDPGIPARAVAYDRDHARELQHAARLLPVMRPAR